ncbi:MAG: DUF4158 domain-containing protein [Streptosporangiaceae bacterium]
MERVPLSPDELVDHWTVLDDEKTLIAGKRGSTRLGFALLLKFYTRHGLFPAGRSEFPDEVVAFVARQVKVPAPDLGFYEWAGSTIEYHRNQVREHLGFRVCSVADAGKLTGWLTGPVAHAERNPDRVRDELVRRCREERIEPPAAGRITRMVRSALHNAEETWFGTIAARCGAEASARVLALIGEDADPAADGEEDEDPDSVLALIKSVPGNVSLESMLTEIRKLTAIRAAGLPPGLFADVAPKVVSGWRARAAVESPSHLRRRLPNSPQSAVTLLAALLAEREREVTDSLVDLLIATVHRIGARAERKVTEELINAFRRVTGKENILFAIAEASLARPADAVREVIYPAVSGGEQTLRELVHEYKTKGPVYRRTVQTTLKASYTGHYRKGLIDLLDVLEFRSTNTAHQPVIEALALIARYARAGNLTYYPAGEVAPAHRGTTGEWADLVYRPDKHGRRRVVRMIYEVATFQALREQLRRKEVWVVGAGRWRDPDEDLPKDFEARRAEHYASLRKPLDPAEFSAALREEMTAALAALNDALPGLPWVDIAERAAGAIRLTPLEAAPEPRNLRRVKNEVARRWSAVPLIDVLKETVLRTGCLQAVTSVAGSGTLPPDVLAERLMLAIYAYGTNCGIRSVISAAHGHSEEDVRYARRRYLTPEVARTVAIAIADATFAARDRGLWGEGSTAVASDSTHFRSWDQNLFSSRSLGEAPTGGARSHSSAQLNGLVKTISAATGVVQGVAAVLSRCVQDSGLDVRAAGVFLARAGAGGSASVVLAGSGAALAVLASCPARRWFSVRAASRSASARSARMRKASRVSSSAVIRAVVAVVSWSSARWWSARMRAASSAAAAWAWSARATAAASACRARSASCSACTVRAPASATWRAASSRAAPMSCCALSRACWISASALARAWRTSRWVLARSSASSRSISSMRVMAWAAASSACSRSSRAPSRSASASLRRWISSASRASAVATRWSALVRAA